MFPTNDELVISIDDPKALKDETRYQFVASYLCKRQH